MTDPTVYLAGPVGAYEDGGAGWREMIENDFGDAFDFRNPLSKYNVPVQDLEIVPGMDSYVEGCVAVGELVEGDKDLLRESDGVLVGYSAVRSIGTPMEVMWARERDYPVAIWVRDSTDIEDLSPWYRYHATALTNDPELALGHLDSQVGGADDGE